MIKELTNRITDFSNLRDGYVLRDGFPFTSITNPSNVYDAIIIKPYGEKSWSPQYPMFYHSISDYVAFINKHRLEKAIIINNSIDFLNECPTLKYLKIVPSDSSNNDFDFSPLYQHPEIISVTCHTSYGFNFQKHSSVDYSQIRGLIQLNMHGAGHLNSNSAKMLKTLNVAESKERNLYGLFNSDVLDSLQIVNSSIVELNGIEQSSSLQCLELYYNKKLEDIAALENSKRTLKRLIIKNCSKIKDFSVLQKLERLEYLSLYGNNVLQDLSFLNSLKNLKLFGFDLNVLNGDLKPCLQIEHVFCARSRKHYNFKNSDLPKSTSSDDIALEGIEEWRRF